MEPPAPVMAPPPYSGTAPFWKGVKGKVTPRAKRSRNWNPTLPYRVNWLWIAPELDRFLVALSVVIVEVRTRRGQAYGSAEESVTPAKQARLAALAETYCDAAGWQGPRRIDVVAVSLSSDGRLLEVRHIENAVRGDPR